MERKEKRTEAEVEAIYDRTFRSVWNIAYTLLKNRVDADDVTADTYVRLMEKDPDFENEEHEKAWLILVAKNLARDRMKSRWAKRLDIEEAEDCEENNPEPDETLGEVLKLPEKYRIVIYLYYYEGYLSREIAAMLRLTEVAVRSRLKRARELLKKKLGGNDL